MFYFHALSILLKFIFCCQFSTSLGLQLQKLEHIETLTYRAAYSGLNNNVAGGVGSGFPLSTC